MKNYQNKMHIGAVFVLSVLVFALLSGCGGSSTQILPGTLAGQVMSAEMGRYPLVPAQGVLVTHKGCGMKTLTDEQGEFKLVNIPSGPGTIVFERSGLLPQHIDVDVQPNRTTTLPSEVCLQTDPASGKKKWTLFVYMAADNSLSDDAIDNLNDLETIGSTPDVSIVVFLDRPNENSKFYYIMKDDDPEKITSPYYDYGSNLNSGDIKTFETISRQVVTDYPASRILLDLWNHGSGIDRTKTGKPRSICSDDTSNSEMTEVQLSGVLAELKSMHGKNLDIIACDACLMATIEVAYEWKDYCDYFVASENIVPGAGFPYGTAYAAVAVTPDIAPINFAKSIVKAYGDEYSVSGEGIETLSVINMSMIGNLNTLVDDYSKALIANGNASEIWTKAYRKDIFFGQADLRDLYSFALLEKNIARNARGYADAEAQAVLDAIYPVGDSKVIVANYYGKLFDEFFHMVPGGISIWGWFEGPIPQNSPYKECSFYSNNHWPDFINFINENHNQ